MISCHQSLARFCRQCNEWQSKGPFLRFMHQPPLAPGDPGSHPLPSRFDRASPWLARLAVAGAGLDFPISSHHVVISTSVRGRCANKTLITFVSQANPFIISIFLLPPEQPESRNDEIGASDTRIAREGRLSPAGCRRQDVRSMGQPRCAARQAAMVWPRADGGALGRRGHAATHNVRSAHPLWDKMPIRDSLGHHKREVSIEVLSKLQKSRQPQPP
ncbi:hypothetical protein QBC34DRAFT_79992 [Podospora aff. communis PSN243]|uniref:Uncharacterized protein n=1 Tax=Podospora aff. communis PSN243 TaxID=3040156 RepID=A0AAV9GR62_9PEZI|nr:hypothetical protein QBC34DRAFT_79992 [Podospora aff. communis PSN243]